MGVDEDADVSGETRPEREFATIEHPPSSELLIQDLNNMVTLHRGMKSRGLENIVFSEQERRIQQFIAELDLYLNDTKKELK